MQRKNDCLAPHHLPALCYHSHLGPLMLTMDSSLGKLLTSAKRSTPATTQKTWGHPVSRNHTHTNRGAFSSSTHSFTGRTQPGEYPSRHLLSLYRSMSPLGMVVSSWNRTVMSAQHGQRGGKACLGICVHPSAGCKIGVVTSVRGHALFSSMRASGWRRNTGPTVGQYTVMLKRTAPAGTASPAGGPATKSSLATCRPTV
jgi:hypothetical protein